MYFSGRVQFSPFAPRSELEECQLTAINRKVDFSTVDSLLGSVSRHIVITVDSSCNEYLRVVFLQQIK